MNSEVNLSDPYRRDVIDVLTNLSKFHNNKSFREMTHDDIIHYPGRDETGLFERAG